MSPNKRPRLLKREPGPLDRTFPLVIIKQILKCLPAEYMLSCLSVDHLFNAIMKPGSSSDIDDAWKNATNKIMPGTVLDTQEIRKKYFKAKNCPKIVELITGRGCNKCGRARIRKIYPQFMLRYCEDCMKESTVSWWTLRDQYRIPESAVEDLPYLERDVWSSRSRCSVMLKMYLISQVEDAIECDLDEYRFSGKRKARKREAQKEREREEDEAAEQEAREIKEAFMIPLISHVLLRDELRANEFDPPLAHGLKAWPRHSKLIAMDVSGENDRKLKSLFTKLAREYLLAKYSSRINGLEALCKPRDVAGATRPILRSDAWYQALAKLANGLAVPEALVLSILKKSDASAARKQASRKRAAAADTTSDEDESKPSIPSAASVDLNAPISLTGIPLPAFQPTFAPFTPGVNMAAERSRFQAASPMIST